MPGIGVKTAAELINIYGDLDSLLERAGEIKQPKRRENLIEFAEQARISRQLVLLREDAPTPLDIDAMKTPARDMDVLKAFLVEQNFKRLLVRIGASADAGTSASAEVVRSMGGTLAVNAGQNDKANDTGTALTHDVQN